jgi:DNA-binding NarL/FixJ family response regulator
MPLHVAIVEDDTLTRDTLARLIADGPDLKCIGAYGSAEEALREIPRTLPDLVLMDINLPGRSGVDCTAALKAARPELLILMLTTNDDSEVVFQALRAGASGYLLKRSSAAEVLNAIEEVRSGGAPMSPVIARLVVSHFHRKPTVNGEIETLSPREREVLELLAKGRLYKEIADQLGVGRSTINRHVEAIYRKLHVQTRTEAVLKLHPR